MSLIYVMLVLGMVVASNQSAVLPPDFKLEGRSAGDLSAEWWQWALRDFPDSNPIEDTSGALCQNNQKGIVWFLAGQHGAEKTKRTCVIPAEKYLFFPVINNVTWAKEQGEASTCEEALKAVAINTDSAIGLYVEVDGVAVKNVSQFRAKTKQCFNVFEHADESHFYNAYPSASDGFWIALKPLSKGQHVIKFGGTYPNNQFSQDVEYQLTVE
ncbi:MAG: hypothetical protein ACKVN9_04805 [Methylophilaceae bacterium]